LTVVLDTGAVVAFMRTADEHHRAALAWFDVNDEELVTTPLAVAEMDHLISRRGGEAARDALWRSLEEGAYIVRWWADGLRETLSVARATPYIGLTDASLVALAGLLRTNRVVTLDQHFRSLTTPGGEPFVVLPADA
jgi:predicted nucleic acid-binding protein